MSRSACWSYDLGSWYEKEDKCIDEAMVCKCLDVAMSRMVLKLLLALPGSFEARNVFVMDLSVLH